MHVSQKPDTNSNHLFTYTGVCAEFDLQLLVLKPS